MRKGFFRVYPFGLGCLLSVNIQASDLLQVFNRACINDPTYQAQVANFHALQQRYPETFSEVLPQLTFDSAINREWDWQTNTTRGNYYTYNYGLSATQTLFNLNIFERIKQSSYTVQAAAMRLSAQQQDLILRTAEAFYAVVRSQVLLNISNQQVRILQYIVKATQTLYDHKEATATELAQAKGRYYQERQLQMRNKQTLEEARQALSVITGKEYGQLPSLKKNFPLIKPKPLNLQSWLAVARKQNLTLLTAQLELLVAQKNIDAQEANFLPSVEGVAEVVNAQEPTVESSALVTQHTSDKKIGAQLSWPFFQGGLTLAQTRAARARYQEANANLRKALLDAEANTRSYYYGVINQRMATIESQSAIHYNRQALQSAEEGYRMGTQTLTDLLQIQGDLSISERSYADNVTEYLLNILRLQQAAGSLSVKSLAIQNSWLAYHG